MINVDLKDHIQKGFTFSIKPQENSGDPPEIEKEANPLRIQRDTSSCRAKMLRYFKRKLNDEYLSMNFIYQPQL